MPENVIPATQPDTTVAGFPGTEDPAYSAPSNHESPEDYHNYDTTRTDNVRYFAVTLTDAGDLVGAVNHRLVAGDRVSFSNIVTTTGLTAGQIYYVRAAGLTADAFTVSATDGGAAVALTTDGAAASESHPSQPQRGSAQRCLPPAP